LFFGRPWVIASHDDISYSSGSLIDDLILDLGAVPIEMSVVEHDRAVALVSHVPQLASTLVASLLQEAPFESLRLAGGGLRDVTRVAGSDPALWMQILSANAEAVTEVLKQLRDSLDGVIEALDTAGEPGSLRAIAGALVEGNQGVARLPGKHGTHTKFARTLVRVDDRPGQLARLFTDIGDAGVNLEDVRIEHAEGAQFGVAEVLVALDAELELEAALTELGWKVLG
ncbi:MAG: prephenate dehydrogenase dimerization domain-containing protein, partial [Agrococcus casei]